jgi:elongation factor P hydroxylase
MTTMTKQDFCQYLLAFLSDGEAIQSIEQDENNFHATILFRNGFGGQGTYEISHYGLSGSWEYGSDGQFSGCSFESIQKAKDAYFRKSW